jgi:hypothetical protein
MKTQKRNSCETEQFYESTISRFMPVEHMGLAPENVYLNFDKNDDIVFDDTKSALYKNIIIPE